MAEIALTRTSNHCGWTGLCHLQSSQVTVMDHARLSKDCSKDIDHDKGPSIHHGI